MKYKNQLYALGIALTYIVLASLWIFFSDYWVSIIVPAEFISEVQTYKGLFFVIMTGFALLLTIRFYYREIQNNEAFYQNTLNNASLGLVEFDDQKILRTNAYFRELFGFNEQQWHLKLEDIVHQSSVSEVKRALAMLNQGFQQVSVEIIPQSKKEHKWHSLHLSKIDRNGKVNFLGIINDISSTKRFSIYTDFLLKILLAIDTKMNLTDVYKTIVQLLIEQTSADFGAFFKLDENKYELSYYNHPLPIHIVQEIDPFHCSEFKTLEIDREQYVLIPIVDGKKRIGVLVLWKKSDVFQHDELNFYKIISSDIGIKAGQKLTQIQRDKDEEHQRMLLESAQVSTWDLNIINGVFKRSANHSKIIDADDDQSTDWTIERYKESLHPEDVSKLVDVYQKISLEQLEHFTYEFRHRTKSGEYKWASTIGKVHYNAKNKPLSVTGITINIHERKQNEELLKASEETYKDLFETNPAALLVVEKNTLQCIGANKAAISLYGYKEDELLTLKLTDLKTEVNKSLFKIPQKPVDSSNYFRLGLWKHLKKNHDVMYVDLSVTDINYQGKEAHLIQVSEVTNVILSQQALSKSETKYRSLFQENPQPVLIVDKAQEIIIDANEIAGHFFQTDKKHLLKKRLNEVFGERLALEIEVLMDESGRKKVAKTETRFSRNNSDEERLIEIAAVSTEMVQNPVVILFVSDITANKSAEQHAMRAFIEGEDKERERVAKELHDSLGQILTAASMNLKSAQKELKEVEFRRKEQLNKGIQFVQQAMDDTRIIAQNLMPKTISDFGLISSLELLIKSYKETLPFSIDLHHNLQDIRLERVVELNVYRIIQEAITNIIKYAEANQVLISIEYSKKSIRVEIKDDGKGMDTNIASEGKGIGLKNMKSRVHIMNGELFIDSIPGSGTTIIVIIPNYHE
ncbi:PAS domain S-box protein [bacterium]|nr:MAG: PAS domain S-box protein [bacterium]